MRALVLCIAALVAADVCAEPRRHREEDRRPASAPAFALLPGGTGAGVSQIQTNLDQLFPSEMVGNWFSLRGDGTTAGPLALSAVGTPTTQSDRVCPNGPDCGALASQRTNGTTIRFATVNTTAPTGNFSVCLLMRVDAELTARVFSKWGTNMSFTFENNLGSGMRLFISSDGTNSTPSGAAPSTIPGALEFWCGTYDASTGGIVVYRNGTQAAVGTKPASTTPFAQSSPITIGATSTGTGGQAMNTFSAFFTEKVLSSATVAAMATAVLPSLQGSRGEAITTTRSTVRGCASGSSGALLPANRPCEVGAALKVWGPVTNVGQNSEAIGSWFALNTGSVTSDNAVGPFGTKVADTVIDNDGSFQYGRYEDTNTTSGVRVFSCWIQDVDCGSVSMDHVTDSTGSASCVKTLSTSWARYECSATIGAGATFVRSRILLNPSSGPAKCSINLWGCQTETGTSVAGPYCPTTTASATCNGDQTTVATDASWPVARGSISFDYTPGKSSGWSGGNFIRALNGSTTGWQLSWGSTGNISFVRWEAGAPTSVTPGVAPSWVVGQRYHLRVDWNPSTASITRDEVQLVSGAFATVSAIGTTANIADNGSGGTTVEGTIGSLCVGGEGVCR
jgi:hypothetical protein